MDETPLIRRFLPYLYWLIGLFLVYFVVNALIAPYASGITLSVQIVIRRLIEIGGFLLAIFAGLAIIEVYFYQIFFRQPRTILTAWIVRILQGVFAGMGLLMVLAFFERTDLFRLQEGLLRSILYFPNTLVDGLRSTLMGIGLTKDSSGWMSGVVLIVIFAGLFFLNHQLTVPRSSKLGMAYLLVLPAFIGVLVLIIYPFLFEIKLAFSNASLGTQATKNAQYGLIYGWNNLVTLFTGTVAKDATFFEVLGRTVLWTVINVVFHVSGGMALALLLHRPMKLQGFYRTLLVFPWAVPTTIVAMALRNEFDSRYGLFNILLSNLNSWLVDVSQGMVSVPVLGEMFAWLAAHIGPVSWRQDPFWAFVSVLITNIWLGIPFMMVIILGGLQSISHEYYEAAEIDGASKFQQFRHITLPLLRPVLTPAVILGVVWTFNKFDVIYLITQGGPQEKTDILVSSMYKAAFSFYRYGFTAMFALVIFVILLAFALVYLRVSGGLKSVTE